MIQKKEENVFISFGGKYLGVRGRAPRLGSRKRSENEKDGTCWRRLSWSLTAQDQFILKYLNFAASSGATIVSTPDFMPQFKTWWWIGM